MSNPSIIDDIFMYLDSLNTTKLVGCTRKVAEEFQVSDEEARTYILEYLKEQ